MVFTVFGVFTTAFRTVFSWFSRFSQNAQLLGRKQEGKPSTTGWCEKKAPEQSQTYREVSCLPHRPPGSNVDCNIRMSMGQQCT